MNVDAFVQDLLLCHKRIDLHGYIGWHVNAICRLDNGATAYVCLYFAIQINVEERYLIC